MVSKKLRPRGAFAMTCFLLCGQATEPGTSGKGMSIINTHLILLFTTLKEAIQVLCFVQTQRGHLHCRPLDSSDFSAVLPSDLPLARVNQDSMRRKGRIPMRSLQRPTC